VNVKCQWDNLKFKKCDFLTHLQKFPEWGPYFSSWGAKVSASIKICCVWISFIKCSDCRLNVLPKFMCQSLTWQCWEVCGSTYSWEDYCRYLGSVLIVVEWVAF
jgi:hypothetical protein